MTNWLRWLWYHRNYFIIVFTPLAFLALPLAVPTPVSWLESVCLCVCASFFWFVRFMQMRRQALMSNVVFKRCWEMTRSINLPAVILYWVFFVCFFCNRAGKTPTWEHLKIKYGATALWLGLILFMFDKLSTCDYVYKTHFSVSNCFISNIGLFL